jgi:hypothetical protein
MLNIEAGLILQVYDRGPNLATWVLPRRLASAADLSPLLGPIDVAEDRPADPWSHVGRFGPVVVVRRTLPVSDPTGAQFDWDVRKHQGFRAEVPLLLPPSEGLFLVVVVGAQGHSLFRLELSPLDAPPPADWVEGDRNCFDRDRQTHARAFMVRDFPGSATLVVTGALDLHSRRPADEPMPEEGRLRDLLEPFADLDFTDEDQWGRVRGALGRIILDHCRRPPRL